MTTFVANTTRDAVTRTVKVNEIPTLVTDVDVAENYVGANGEKKTQYYRISLWRESGAKQGKYLTKGRPVQIEGRVKGRGYLTQEIVDQIKAGADWKKLTIPCQLVVASPKITFITANPGSAPDADDVGFPVEEE